MSYLSHIIPSPHEAEGLVISWKDKKNYGQRGKHLNFRKVVKSGKKSGMEEKGIKDIVFKEMERKEY